MIVEIVCISISQPWLIGNFQRLNRRSILNWFNLLGMRHTTCRLLVIRQLNGLHCRHLRSGGGRGTACCLISISLSFKLMSLVKFVVGNRDFASRQLVHTAHCSFPCSLDTQYYLTLTVSHQLLLLAIKPWVQPFFPTPTTPSPPNVRDSAARPRTHIKRLERTRRFL